MRAKNRTATVLALGLLALLARPALASEDAAAGRAILENHRAAVVTVQMVVKISSSFGGSTNENESKEEATGTVISPDGLTVLALSSTDPSSIYKTMMGGGQDFRMDSQINDLKMLMHDNTEIPAEVVIRDVELDLAFIRPLKKPEAPMAHVSLEENGEVQLLDRVVTLNRLGRVANRVFSASFEYIDAVVERPRRYYIPGNDPTSTTQGSPVFRLDGKLVGVFVLRAISAEASAGARRNNVMPIILPAADVLEGVQQVPPYPEN
ncbi:MAG: trypsin-like peptidase domain-containing protein [Candidatus Hydrogenedentes bacterium]|nr:trypsin-like peptidase domain-containing protein [Candidatus Hydrogenedentota bacterium]